MVKKITISKKQEYKLMASENSTATALKCIKIYVKLDSIVKSSQVSMKVY